ncbi:hypothetical protein E2562_030456, partial [Oryza meyeriana var. granulata]
VQDQAQTSHLPTPILSKPRQRENPNPSLAVVAPRRLLLLSHRLPPAPAARRRRSKGSSGVRGRGREREMGLREKKRNQRRVLARRSAAPRHGEGKDFLPLEERPGKKRVREEQPEELENTSTVLYIGHIPHGFYEEQMQGFFQQFGTVKRLRIARNRKTGKSKHYGFIEFENPEVAKIVADEMNNYLLFEHTLQIALVPPEKVHPKLWKGVRRGFVPIDRVAIERRRLNKDKTIEEHKKLVDRIVKRDEKRRKRIKAAGIDYKCPPLIGSVQPSAKKIKFIED